MANKVNTAISVIATKLLAITGVQTVERRDGDILEEGPRPRMYLVPHSARRDGNTWTVDVALNVAMTAGAQGDEDLSTLLGEIDAVLSAATLPPLIGGVVNTPDFQYVYDYRKNLNALAGAVGTFQFQFQAPIKG